MKEQKQKKITFPLVSIVMVNYNGRELLEKFLPSIQGLSYPNFEIIMVDNASMDESVQFLRGNFPGVKLVALKENLGWGAGSNRGVEHANGEYIWLLNTDVEVTRESLITLVDFMQAHTDVGVCSPLIYYYARKEVLESAGANFNKFGQASSICRGSNKPRISKPYEITQASGAALLIRKDIYDVVGGFDEDIFLLGDDIDISVRCWIYGYKAMLVPSSKVYHIGSATISVETGRAKGFYYHVQSLTHFMLKDLQVSTLLTALPCSILSSITTALIFLIRGKPHLLSMWLKAILWNVKMLPKTLRKRRKIQSNRKIPDRRFLNLEKKKI